MIRFESDTEMQKIGTKLHKVTLLLVLLKKFLHQYGAGNVFAEKIYVALFWQSEITSGVCMFVDISRTPCLYVAALI